MACHVERLGKLLSADDLAFCGCNVVRILQPIEEQRTANANNQCERGGLRQRLWVYGVCAMLGEP